jgi:ParB-like chromosome segregation protein Spo0J
MNVVPPPITHRGARLLVAHLESLDPEATPARKRVAEELGNELTRKLIFALANRRPVRRAA